MNEKQIQLLKMLCKRAGIPVEDAIKWIKEGKVTLTEIRQGIFGMPTRPQYNSYDQF